MRPPQPPSPPPSAPPAVAPARAPWRTALGRLATSRAAVALLVPGVALLAALLVGNLLILASGESPAGVFSTLFAGTWGNAYGLGQVLFKATPLLLAGLAVALPFRAGLFNIGVEGQATLGALSAGLVGAALPADCPAVVALPLTMLAAMLGGLGCAALAGALKARFGAHEVITTLMLNFIAAAFANYVVVHWAGVPESLHTAPIAPGAELFRLADGLPVFRGSAVNGALVIALIAAGAVAYVLFRTTAGFRLTVAGSAPEAARTAGISLGRVTLTTFAAAGAIAGLIGVNFVQGYKHYFEGEFTGGVGYMGIAVALLGRNHPGGILLAALLFGTLSQGGLAINALVPKEIVEVLQAVIILTVVVAGREAQVLLRRLPGGGAP